jgi:exodeoxyribonuclease V beta subunit
MCRRHGRPAGDAARATRLVHAAYTTPVRLGDQVVPGLASATAALREMEFLYPMPEPQHPLLGRPAAAGGGETWTIERGVARGFVDFLFEHAGRVYLCDWKSDELADYDAARLARHCEEQYDVQERIYTLAALRMFGIASPADYAARWGGVVFCFLRARTDADERRGIVFHRQAWAEILRWERDMAGPAFWGASP